ncbi:MAG TPA: carboxymuconolactone decarboxylase family protein [Acidimicrobiales bacterium]|nr:carboxymuconolactone decarboxylase family protein [Acidimicrobiales bacterium]
MPDQNDTPVLDALASMTVASLENCHLEEDELLLVRIAALAAVDARPISYLAHLGPAVEAGITVERVQDVLVGVAAILGTARTMSAALNIAEALGFAIAVAEQEAGGS